MRRVDKLYGSIHPKLNCVKELHEKLNCMFSGTGQVSHQVCQFFLSVLCLLVRVTVVGKNKVSTGKLRKLWDSLSELRSSLCERRLERTVLRPALLPV